jgi:hypothetical protein
VGRSGDPERPGTGPPAIGRSLCGSRPALGGPRSAREMPDER